MRPQNQKPPSLHRYTRRPPQCYTAHHPYLRGHVAIKEDLTRQTLSNILCLTVCLYPINVKKVEPIRPKFCVGSHMTTEMVYGC